MSLLCDFLCFLYYNFTMVYSQSVLNIIANDANYYLSCICANVCVIKNVEKNN